MTVEATRMSCLILPVVVALFLPGNLIKGHPKGTYHNVYMATTSTDGMPQIITRLDAVVTA